MSVETDVVDRLFDPRLCPATNRLMLGRRFALPNYRAPDYYPQDSLNKRTLANLLLPTLPDGFSCLDDVMRGCVANTFLAASHGRPVLFLERELGEALLGSRLPEDLSTTDIRPLWPGFRIMLPRRLLTIERDGEVASLMFIDFGFLRANVDCVLPREIAVELDLLSYLRFGESATNCKLSRLSFTYPEDTISINGLLDGADGATAYGITKPWPIGKLGDVSAFRGSLRTDWPTDAADDSFLFRLENLALNLLILLSQVPLEYQPEVIERREKREGKRVIPALLRARWVGDHLVRARTAGAVHGELATGRHVSGHWKRAHWKRQPCGPGFSQRKLIWILPYHAGTEAAA